MDVAQYFDSLSLELSALKNRVRHLIKNKHWPTDGEWKESVLRTILRRHLPSTVKVGRGFVVKPSGSSKQIDVLIYDVSKPLLYQDGDLVMITTDSVKGIIEVKSTISGISKLTEYAEVLADNAEFVYNDFEHKNERKNIFVGLFCYDGELRDNHSRQALEKLGSIAGGDRKRVVTHLCLGSSFFIRFWGTSPHSEPDYNSWHSYWLDFKAPGYFINNVVDAVARDSVKLNQDVWFPLTGKETKKLDELPLFDP